MNQQRVRLVVVGLALAGLIGVGGMLSPARAQNSAQQAALEVIAQINAYRVAQGHHPLAPNDRLEAMARDQATYVLSLPALPEDGDIHLDAQGRSPRQQAVLPAYHWETYGSNQQVLIGENAAVGSVQFAMNFWIHSTIHNQAMVNDDYREIGVWAAPYPSGYLFMVAFGGRPNEIPVLVDPLTQTLYIANEFNTRGTGTWLHQARSIRLFDAAGGPLTAVMPWQFALPIPDHTGDTLSVMFDDGTNELIRKVDLQRDIVILPDTLALVEGLNATPTPSVVAATPTLTPVPTLTLTPSLTPLAFAIPVPTPTQIAGLPGVPTATPVQVTSTPSLTPVPPTPSLTPSPAAPDILLIYDSRSLTLLNVSEQRIDISQVVIAGSGRTLAATRWKQVAPVPLDRFAPGSCMEVWAWTEPQDLPQPAACHTRVAFIYIAPETRFWANADFTVMQGSSVLATCAKAPGTCAVTLP